MKNSAKLIFVVLFIGACPAAAQDSTTRCQTDYFGNVTCHTEQNPGIDWRLGQSQRPNAGDAFMRGWQEAQERVRLQQQLRQMRQPQESAPSYRPSDERTIDQVCVEEFSKAVAAGNEEQAASIRRVCSAKPR